MRKIFAGIVSLIVSYGMVYTLVMPTLQNYPRLARMAQRFEYTDEALWLFIFLAYGCFIGSGNSGKCGRVISIFFIVATSYCFLLCSLRKRGLIIRLT